MMRDIDIISEKMIPVSLHSIRKKLIDRLWFGTFIIALVGAPASALRYLSTGWLTLYNFHILFALVVTVVFIFRKKIPYTIKKHLLLLLFSFIGILGIFTLGVLGAGVWWLIMSCFLVSTLYSLRAGVWSVALSTLIVVLAGYCFSNGLIKLPLDANNYVESVSSWVSLLVAAIVMPFFVFQSMASFQHATVNLLNVVDKQRKQIVKMATHDQLTGVPLLNKANDRLKSAILNAEELNKKVALLFMDIDGFKKVNDAHGHDAGDQILKQVVQRLLTCIDKNNDLVARIGGDEFILILTEVDDSKLLKSVAQRIIDEVAKPYLYSDNTIIISSSIGISLFPDHAKSPGLLRKSADKAMYKVKESGKNGYAFAMTQQV